jgi:hypothetical protein
MRNQAEKITSRQEMPGVRVSVTATSQNVPKHRDDSAGIRVVCTLSATVTA